MGPAASTLLCEVGPSGRKEKGRRSSQLASRGHPRFRLVPLARLGVPRRLGLRLCSESPLRPCLIQSLAALFLPLLQASSVTVSFPSHSVCLSLCSSLYLALSLCICFCVCLCLSLLPSTSLYLAVSLSLSLSLSLSPPSYFPVLLLFFGLLPLGVCTSPTRQPGDTLGHCPASPSQSLPHSCHLRAASVFPLLQWGVEGAPWREDTVPSICSGARGPCPLCHY